MKITDLIDIVESNGKGVRAYRECANAAQEAAIQQPTNATVFFLLAAAAEKFVDTYDDQPLQSEGVEDQFLRFKSYVDTLSVEKAELLPAFNRVALDIINHRLKQLTV